MGLFTIGRRVVEATGPCTTASSSGSPRTDPRKPELRGLRLLPPTEILKAEKDVAQSLLDAKEQACQGGAELQQIEARLQKASEDDTHLKASLLYPFPRLSWEV